MVEERKAEQQHNMMNTHTPVITPWSLIPRLYLLPALKISLRPCLLLFLATHYVAPLASIALQLAALLAVQWAGTCTDVAFVDAWAPEAHLILSPGTQDAQSREPAPRMIRDILNMPEGPIRREWLKSKSIHQELKTLIEAQMFVEDVLLDG
jgi:hypothetical protein